jgi:hypothetical protein
MRSVSFGNVHVANKKLKEQHKSWGKNELKTFHNVPQDGAHVHSLRALERQPNLDFQP